MKRFCLIAIICALVAASQGRSKAQFGGTGGGERGTVQSSGSTYGDISLYPVAFFDTGGLFGTGTAGTRTFGGGLIALDLGKVDKASKARYEAGVWYWGRQGSDLYETHFRAISRSGLGVQVGYLGTTQGFLLRQGITNSLNTGFSALDGFVLYELNSNRTSASKWKSWTLQFGGGIFVDQSKHLIGPSLQTVSNSTTANLTFFANGSLWLTPKISVNLSEWVIRDSGVDLNRVALGMGYSF